MLYRPVKMYNLGLTKLGYSNVHKRYSERCAFIITWTICRGCTESVGKFPRPWTGTVSPRIESKRCTCSQDNTQNRRHCSDTSPEDMSMERTTSFKKAKTSALLPHRYRSFQTDEAPTQNRLWKAQLFHSCSRYQLFIYRDGSWGYPAALVIHFSQSTHKQESL